MRVECAADPAFNDNGKLFFTCHIDPAGDNTGVETTGMFLYAGESFKRIPAGCSKIEFYNSNAASACEVYFEMYSDDDITGATFA